MLQGKSRAWLTSGLLGDVLLNQMHCEMHRCTPADPNLMFVHPVELVRALMASRMKSKSSYRVGIRVDTEAYAQPPRPEGAALELRNRIALPAES